MDSEQTHYTDLNTRAEADMALRPKRLADFIGQDRVCRNLKVALEAAAKRGQEPLEHLLLSGLPGLGKTTLAHILSHETGGDVRVTSGPALERTGDLVGLLTGLKRGDILFIDEVHRLPTVLEEYLYSAMEDYAVDIVIDQGPAARSVRLSLEQFTLVGATTREGLLSAAFRSRFGLLEKLELYPDKQLVKILQRSASLLRVPTQDGVLEIVASRARGTPRIANRLLRRVRDLAEVRNAKSVSPDIASESLEHLGIDGEGLEETDRKILRCLLKQAGRPVGLKTIAAAVGETEDTLECVYEPYLLTRGFIQKTPRGRQITKEGQHHLGEEGLASESQSGLFS